MSCKPRDGPLLLRSKIALPSSLPNTSAHGGRSGVWASDNPGSTLYTANGANRNTAVGSKAGHDITSGGDNTILGAYAGDALTTGSGNIIIGYNAAASAVGVSNEITLGDTNITKFRIPGLNFVVKDSTATEDYVLTVDANGEAGWEAASGGGPGDINTSAGYESPATLADNWTIGANNNAMFPGPMTVAANKTVTVPANRTLTVV